MFELCTDCANDIHHIKQGHLRRSHTIPSALSPKSLSCSLRHTAVGVFLLDSLKKKTADMVFISEMYFHAVLISHAFVLWLSIIKHALKESENLMWAFPSVPFNLTSKPGVYTHCNMIKANTQLYSLVENNLHRHTRFHYRHFHPLTAQVNWHDSYSHCKHNDMCCIKLVRQTGNTKVPEVQ